MNILVYYPYNQRSVEQQSVMEMLIQKGHKVFLLTLTSEGFLHIYVRKLGVQAFSSPMEGLIKLKNIYKNAKQLVSFCKEHRIEIILAHQQIAAIPLVFAQPFLKARAFYIRHNSDEDYKNNPVKARIMNGFINRFVKNIIAPSDAVFNYMVKKEKVPLGKIRRINYGYNFDQYEKPDIQNVDTIRDKYSCRLLVVSIARLVPAKRHILMFEAIRELVKEGADIKMICLGGGQLKEELEAWILNNKLDQYIFLVGVKPNVFDYLSAADVLLHLSETEASNSVVKEAGLTYKPAIVCNNVGDFGDYIVNNENGFLVSKEKPVPETVSSLKKYYSDHSFLHKTGMSLHKSIVEIFDIKNVVKEYEALID